MREFANLAKTNTLNHYANDKIKRSLPIISFPQSGGLPEFPRLLPTLALALAFAFLPFDDSSDCLAFLLLPCVVLMDLPLLVQLQPQPLLFHALLVGQPLSQIVPFEFGQILQVPQILAVEVAFLLYHLLSIEA